MLNPSLERVTYGRDDVLLKDPSRFQYLVVNPTEEEILRKFEGNETISTVLENLMKSTSIPSLGAFYDLVNEACETGILQNKNGGKIYSRKKSSSTKISFHFLSAIWVIFIALTLTLGISVISNHSVIVGSSPSYWIHFFIGTILSVSISSMVAIVAQSSLGSTPLNVHVSWRRILPYLTYDTRDSIILGRWRESLVALAGLTGPFLFLLGIYLFEHHFKIILTANGVAYDPLVYLSGFYLAVWFSLILITIPFGASWGQNLVRSLFRNHRDLPHKIPDISGNNLFSELLYLSDEFRNQRYYIAYITYLIIWLGLLFRLSTEFVAVQFNQVVSTFLLSETFGFRLYFVVGIMVFGIIILTLTLFYAVWAIGADFAKEIILKKTILRKTILAKKDKTLENLIKKEWPDQITEKLQLATFIEEVSLFVDWTPSAHFSLLKKIPIQEFPIDTVLIEEDKPNQHFYLIFEGEVIVTRSGEPVAKLHTRHVFGETSMLQNIPATATVKVSQHLKAFVFDRPQFLEIATKDFMTGYLLDLSSSERKTEDWK